MTLKYKDIAQILREKVKSGIFPISAKIPGEAALAIELGVSRPTIKSAVNLLVKEGTLSCVPSVGSFVLRKPGERLLVGYMAPDLADPFHTEMIASLELLAGKGGFGLAVAMSGETLEDEQNAFLRLKNIGVVGILASKGYASVQSKLPVSFPLVWCGGIPLEDEHDKVTINNKKGMMLLAEHLISLEVRNIGYAGAGNPATGDGRLEILKDTLKSKNLPSREEWFNYSEAKGEVGGREIFTRILKSDLPEAIVCYNDWTALGIIGAALENGIAVPGTLKVTGFDNIVISRYFKIPITTIDYKISEIALHAFDFLVQRMEGSKKRAQTMIIDPELLVRESTVR